MTDESRGEFLFAALAVSLVVHGVVMFFMRPQVMTHVSGASSIAKARQSAVSRQRPERDDVISIETIKDIDAMSEAPEAERDDSMPTVSALDSFAAPLDVSIPEIQVSATLPKMTVESAPAFSEKIHIPEDEASYTAPVAGGIEPLPSSASGRNAPPPPPTPLTAEDLAGAIPEIEAPEMIPEPDPTAELAAAALPVDDTSERKAAEFKVSDEVLAELNEKTVEAEKAAVRGLLDVSKARDLDGTVAVSSTSATDMKEWTYFRVKIDPGQDLKTVPKDVVILLDASGSISNERLRSCRAAAKRILRSCMNTGDRFNLVAFRDEFQYAFRQWRECDQPSFDAAEAWMDRLAAHGRTDVFATISSVLKLPRDPKRPLIALVVTDGDANEGVKETSAILSKFTDLNDGLVSVYMYGVRDTANRELIDVLTHGNRGESFIYSGERKYAGRKIEELSDKFRDPVLTDLRIVFASGSGAEAYPRLLKNLYKGERVDILGRVPRGTPEVSFSLKGLNGDKPYEGFFTIKLSASEFEQALPGEWMAEKSIDSRLHPEKEGVR